MFDTLCTVEHMVLQTKDMKQTATYQYITVYIINLSDARVWLKYFKIQRNINYFVKLNLK